MTLLLALAAFLGGVVLVVVATERLLEGLVGIARAARVAPFVAAAALSGLEAENVAVGLAAGSRGAADVALGTAFGGAIFLLCAALGLGAVMPRCACACHAGSSSSSPPRPLPPDCRSSSSTRRGGPVLFSCFSLPRRWHP